MTVRSVVIHLLAVLVLTSSVRGQDEETTWHSFAGSLAPGTFLVVYLKDGTTVEGHLIQVADNGLRILPKTRLPVPVRNLEFTRIRSINPRKEGMSAGAKVLLGVGIAGAAMVVLVVAILPRT